MHAPPDTLHCPSFEDMFTTFFHTRPLHFATNHRWAHEIKCLHHSKLQHCSHRWKDKTNTGTDTIFRTKKPEIFLFLLFYASLSLCTVIGLQTLLGQYCPMPRVKGFMHRQHILHTTALCFKTLRYFPIIGLYTCYFTTCLFTL